MKRILTGDRPTSDKFHLGNYIGSLKNRVKLQDEYETFIMLADLHALTTHYDRTQELGENIRGLMLDYLSVGLNPEKVSFFLQSQVPEIAEIAYYLSTLSQRSAVAKQPALKEKLDQGASDTVALFYYPILMASDIVSIRGDLVPVGKDQKAHVEFARDIAKKFNETYREVFVIPEPLIGEVPTLVGTDGQAKMSKSLNNAIFLCDTAKQVEQKVLGMYTDPKRIHTTDPGKVEGNPVFKYLDAFGKESDKAEIRQNKERYQKGQIGDVEVKQFLVEVLNDFLDPIREKREHYEGRQNLIEEILTKGSNKARLIAQETLKLTRTALGIEYFKGMTV